MAEAEDILKLIDSAAKSARDDMRAVIENHLDASERVIANFSMVKSVSDGSKLLEMALVNPKAFGELTKENPT